MVNGPKMGGDTKLEMVPLRFQFLLLEGSPCQLNAGSSELGRIGRGGSPRRLADTGVVPAGQPDTTDAIELRQARQRSTPGADFSPTYAGP